MKRNELMLVTGGGFIYFATNKPNWKMAYDEFCGVCNAGGIRIDNIMPVRAMLRRVGDGKVVSVMPENIKVDMSKSIRGGGFHSSAY